MPKTIALITIHGMGDTARDYYAECYDALKKKLGRTAWGKLLFKPLYYQDILQGSQAEIFNRMRDQIDWMKLRKFLLYGFSDAASLEYKKEEADSPYFQTQEMILDSLDALFDEFGEQEVPLVVLAQSLGCQIISSYIWDAEPGRKAAAGVWSVARDDGVEFGSKRDNFRRMRTLQRIYTTGCNIPIFVAGHKKIVAISKPTDTFKWHNFFDEDDVLGWPLKPLSPSYSDLVEDIPVNAGSGVLGTIVKSWNPMSHGQYWTDNEIIAHLATSIKQLA